MKKIIMASALLCGSALAITGCQSTEGQLKTGNPLSLRKARGQHDSLDITSQRVPLLMWGNKIKQNVKVNEKVYTTSVAPTISVLLNKGLPLDANAKILYDELLMDAPKLKSLSVF